MAQKSVGGAGIANQIGVVLLTTILLFFLVAFAGEALEEYRLHRELERINQKLNRLKEEGIALEVTATFMESPAYAERELKKMGWGHPGETWVAPRAALVTPVPSLQPTPVPMTTPDENVQSDQSGPPYWDEWLELLLKPYSKRSAISSPLSAS